VLACMGWASEGADGRSFSQAAASTTDEWGKDELWTVGLLQSRMRDEVYRTVIQLPAPLLYTLVASPGTHSRRLSVSSSQTHPGGLEPYFTCYLLLA
jgi:hypothetical protein